MGLPSKRFWTMGASGAKGYPAASLPVRLRPQKLDKLRVTSIKSNAVPVCRIRGTDPVHDTARLRSLGCCLSSQHVAK